MTAHDPAECRRLIAVALDVIEFTAGQYVSIDRRCLRATADQLEAACTEAGRIPDLKAAIGYEIEKRDAAVRERDSLRQQLEAMAGQVADQNARVLYLKGLINTPHTDDFVLALQLEAAHQIERWGVEHDAGKRPEDWIALLTYLLGKAAKAHYDSNVDKLKHHIVTVAAVGLNWFRALTGDSNAMRPGVGP